MAVMITVLFDSVWFVHVFCVFSWCVFWEVVTEFWYYIIIVVSTIRSIAMSRPGVTLDVNSGVFHINESMKLDNNYADLSDQLGVFRYSQYCCYMICRTFMNYN